MINSRFEITAKLGEGRNKVFRCKDITSGGTFALKVMSPGVSEEEKSKFAYEFYTIRKLNHPSIIKAYEHGFIAESDHEEIEAGSTYILLELFEGCELTSGGEFSDKKMKDVLVQVCSALQYLHLSNYIYYDLKPENILVAGDEDPLIKIIDLGFAATIHNALDKEARGTAEYIAPELLKKEDYDYRVDYYSLGMLLYRVIYGGFPFDNSSEINVYKAQLGENFKYPENKYSLSINNVMKRLLQKDPRERYLNVIQIFDELSYTPPAEVLSSWIPARSFCGRKDTLNILNRYISGASTGDVFVLRGSEGSGKSAVLAELYNLIDESVIIDNAKSRYGQDFITSFVEKIFYTENIYCCADELLKKRIESFIKNPPNNITDEVKGIFSQLIRKCRFVLLLDDFNFLDELSLQVFREIIPLFQVNNIKVIITENSDRPCISDFIRNQHQVILGPFTETQVQEFLDRSLYNYFPKKELKQLILLYADLLPGSIESFIKDLVLFGIISFGKDSISVSTDPSTLNILRQSHEYFYKMRLGRLDKDEVVAAEYLSLFETIPGIRILAEVLKKSKTAAEYILHNLQNKNILHLSGNLNQISFTSEGVRSYIYSQIDDKKKIHLDIAEVLENFPGNQNREIAYQLEHAEEYLKSLEKFMILFRDSAATDAYSYQKQLLKHVLNFPLPDEKKIHLKFELCKVLHKSGDASSALDLCEELLIYISDPELLNEILLLKGLCLMRCGKPDEGIKGIIDLVEILEDEERKQSLRSEIASAYLDLNNFEEAESISRQIIESEFASAETKGMCYNFLGLTAIHRDNDFDKAYENFVLAEKIYSEAGLKFRTSQMQSNLGNIVNIKGDTQKAEELWNSSFELNSTIGNLYQEANLQLNFGVMNFEKLKYEKSIEHYRNALSVFSSTGDLKGEGLVNYNLGEIYYLSCEYGSALECVQHARNVFQHVQDSNEELETLFLLGRIYLTLGSKDKVHHLLNDFNLLMHKVPGDKHSYNFRYLKVLFNSGSLNYFHEIKDIISYYSSQGDKNNYFRAFMESIKFLYGHELYKEAFEEISDKNLIAAAQENNFFNAEWNLYFGLIAEKLGGFDVHPSEYYLKALEMVEDLSISELTWELLLVVAQFYYDRGNYLRAEEYANYSKTLLSFIAENIGEGTLRSTYLNRKEIKNAFAVLGRILKTDG